MQGSAFSKFERRLQSRASPNSQTDNYSASNCSFVGSGKANLMPDIDPSTLCPQVDTMIFSKYSNQIEPFSNKNKNALESSPCFGVPSSHHNYTNYNFPKFSNCDQILQESGLQGPKLTSNLDVNSTRTLDICKSSALLPPLHTIVQGILQEDSNYSGPEVRSPDLTVLMKHTTYSSAGKCGEASAPALQSSSPAPSGKTYKSQTKVRPDRDAEAWRRPPKRWGLADWPRDDMTATERRREQNRVAQRRFREKRAAGVAANNDNEPPTPS